MICPNCGAELDDDALSCYVCGYQFYETDETEYDETEEQSDHGDIQQCPYCGSEIEAGLSVCPICQSELGVEQPEIIEEQPVDNNETAPAVKSSKDLVISIAAIAAAAAIGIGVCIYAFTSSKDNSADPIKQDTQTTPITSVSTEDTASAPETVISDTEEVTTASATVTTVSTTTTAAKTITTTTTTTTAATTETTAAATTAAPETTTTAAVTEPPAVKAVYANDLLNLNYYKLNESLNYNFREQIISAGQSAAMGILNFDVFPNIIIGFDAADTSRIFGDAMPSVLNVLPNGYINKDIMVGMTYNELKEKLNFEGVQGDNDTYGWRAMVRIDGVLWGIQFDIPKERSDELWEKKSELAPTIDDPNPIFDVSDINPKSDLAFYIRSIQDWDP